MSSPLSLSDVVAALTGVVDSAASRSTARLVQNWVTAGLVRPLPQPRAGRGVHRQFDQEEVRKIAVLVELNRHRLPWAILQLAASLFDQLRERPDAIRQTRPAAALAAQQQRHAPLRVLLQAAITGSRVVFLVIGANEDGDLEVALRGDNWKVAEVRSATFVNLTAVLRPHRNVTD